RRAFSKIQDGSFPRAQDLYATFILLHFARSYAGIPDILVNYNFGLGITGNPYYDLTRFRRFCRASAVADALANFVEGNALEGVYGSVVTKIRRGLLSDGLAQWMNHLRPGDTAAAYDLLAERWSAEELVTTVAEKHIGDPEQFSLTRLAESVHGMRSPIQGGNRQSRTIGV